jgi:hypothetical protein
MMDSFQANLSFRQNIPLSFFAWSGCLWLWWIGEAWIVWATKERHRACNFWLPINRPNEKNKADPSFEYSQLDRYSFWTTGWKIQRKTNLGLRSLPSNLSLIRKLWVILSPSAFALYQYNDAYLCSANINQY